MYIIDIIDVPNMGISYPICGTSIVWDMIFQLGYPIDVPQIPSGISWNIQYVWNITVFIWISNIVEFGYPKYLGYYRCPTFGAPVTV